MAITLRLDEDHARKLNELAQRSGTSKHDAVLRAIDEEFNRMPHRQRVTVSASPTRSTNPLNAGGTHWSDSGSNAVRVSLT
jgi:toxin-antitoxin system protein